MTLIRVSAGILAISSRMFAFKSCLTTKGSDTSSVKPVDWTTKKPLMKACETSNVKPVAWRKDKPLTKVSETSSVMPFLHVQRVLSQSPSCKDSNEGHREVFASLNDRKV